MRLLFAIALLNSKLVGIEYSLVKYEPPGLFIIHKCERKSPSLALLLTAYYILDGTIYQCPTLKDILESRIAASMCYLSKSIDYAKRWLVFDPEEEPTGAYKLRAEEGRLDGPEITGELVFDPAIAQSFERLMSQD